MKIFLIGFPGCGKTFLGKEAAQSLKYPFLDTDALVETKEGTGIHDLFGKKGRRLFRLKEAEVLRTLSGKRQAVIATGGGLPCFHQNMIWMNDKGLTVYMEASAAFLFHRLLKEKNTRPLISGLTDIELMIYITETLVTRRRFYEQAQVTINAETCTPAKLVAAIRKKIK